MNQIDLQGQVLSLLENFKGPEPLKELFWSKLNYDRENKPIGRRKWPDPASAALHEDPTLLAAGGENGNFHILYSRLAKDRLSLADERIATSRLLKDHPYGLFVFSDRTQTHCLARAGRNLRGLMRILMFKRFESSVFAFQQTVRLFKWRVDDRVLNHDIGHGKSILSR